MSEMKKMVVLAYSGGLDTSVAIRWLKDTYGYQVVALSLDLGETPDAKALEKKALISGAEAVVIKDAKDEFVSEFIKPALWANALYQKEYPLATALARPLIAKHLVATAREFGAEAVAHGCTGKGNDQVRFDVAVASLAPDLTVVAPVREWAWTRAQEIAYADVHGIPVPATLENPYSVDANLWGRSVEGGVLEDPWVEPPAACYAWTAGPGAWPVGGEEITIGFEEGVPVQLNGEPMALKTLIVAVGETAGRHGIGRIDLIEDRLVGIKSREVYEAPAAVTLIAAHRAAEALTLPKDLLQHKAGIEEVLSQSVYNGLWFSPLTQSLLAYLKETQQAVTAEVRLRLQAGKATVVGRRSPCSLYRSDLATYGEGDTFDATAAVGFIKIWGLPLKAVASAHGR